MAYFLYIPFSFFKFSWNLHEISTELIENKFLFFLSFTFVRNLSEESQDEEIIPLLYVLRYELVMGQWTWVKFCSSWCVEYGFLWCLSEKWLKCGSFLTNHNP